MGAELEDFQARTLNDLLGAMNRPLLKVNLDGLNYLIDDSDGDWLSLQASIEITASNCLQVGYHILLAEMTNYQAVLMLNCRLLIKRH